MRTSSTAVTPASPCTTTGSSTRPGKATGRRPMPAPATRAPAFTLTRTALLRDRRLRRFLPAHHDTEVFLLVPEQSLVGGAELFRLDVLGDQPCEAETA